MNCIRGYSVGRLFAATLLLGLGANVPVYAQTEEPSGSFTAIGLAGINGRGVGVGYVNVQEFFIREISVHSDLRSSLNPGDESSLIVFSFGGALRVFGFERNIGNVGYRGYDIDVGFRVGPGFSFSTRETRAEKNRRFNLFMEPFLRISARSPFLQVLFIETGTTRPHLRFGAWIQIGSGGS